MIILISNNFVIAIQTKKKTISFLQMVTLLKT